MVLVVDVGPRLEQVRDVGQTRLLAGGVVQRGAAQSGYNVFI